MGYDKHEWAAGDVITSAKLNEMEEGIANAGSGSSEVNPTTANKGDIIRLNITGKFEPYRVLSVNGSVVKLVAMQPVSTSVYFNADGTTVDVGDGTVILQYKNGELDKFLNTFWYNNCLTAKAKAAIVPQTISQDLWTQDTSGNPCYINSYVSAGRQAENNISFHAGKTAEIGSRNVFALSVQDIIDYLEVEPDGTFTGEQIKDFMGFSGEYWLLRSAYNTEYGDPGCWFVLGSFGRLSGYGSNGCVRPAFVIDLSSL